MIFDFGGATDQNGLVPIEDPDAGTGVCMQHGQGQLAIVCISSVAKFFFFPFVK